MKRKASEILFFMQGIVIFFLIGFLIFINNMEQALSYVWTCVIVIVLVLIIIGLLCIYNYVYKKEQRVKQEQVRLQEVLMVREENQACHAVIHDTRHFLYTVQSLLEREDIEEAKKLLQDCVDAKLTKKRFCNRAVLNVILQYYQSVCDKAGISLAVDIRGAVLSDLNDTEMTVLFGNLLENALDACRECTDTAPFIRIRAREEGGHIALAVDNTCCRAPMEENGRFRSSKHEGFGTGTASVRSIAQRYHGVTEFHYQDHIFFASVFL